MWTSIALVTALSLAPSQAAPVKLTNIRPTYWTNGVVRPDSKILPGDVFFLTFDVENLKADDDGKVSYRTELEMTDSKGKVQFKGTPQDLDAVRALGATRIQAEAHIETEPEFPTGEYTLKVTVTDRATKQTDTLTQKFEVVPLTFGLIRADLAYGPSGTTIAPPIGVVGQSFLIGCAAIGFQGNAKGEPGVSIETQILDDATGQPTIPKSLTVMATKDSVGKLATANVFPVVIPLTLTRPGKFTVKLKASDTISKKTAELSLPITIVDLK